MPRLTNGFSKKVENLAHAVSSATCAPGPASASRSPAMAAGVAEYPWSLTQIAKLLD